MRMNCFQSFHFTDVINFKLQTNTQIYKFVTKNHALVRSFARVRSLRYLYAHRV